MSILATLACLTVTSAPPMDAPLRLSAQMPARIAPGEPVEIRIEVAPGEGVDASAAGLPRPILQVQVPEGVHLAGRELSDAEQARNDFLYAPYESMIKVGEHTLSLTIDDTLAPDAMLAINLIAYVRRRGDDSARFVRRRVNLPLQPGAKASSDEPATNSRWGPPGFETLAIGDRVPDLELPRADGSIVRLRDLLAAGDVIGTTYRAFW